MATTAELFLDAFRFHQSGQLAQAEPLYRQVLQDEPAHADALHLLGVLAHQTGHHHAALSLIRQAIARNPAAALFHINLGVVYKDQGELAEALDCYGQALRINPNNAEAQTKITEAIAFCRQAVRKNPAHAEAHNILGSALYGRGELTEAIDCFRDALRINPNLATVHYRLGVALQAAGQADEAIACFRQVLLVNPNHADAAFHLGNIFFERAQTDEAEAWLRRGLLKNPNCAAAHNSLGMVLRDRGRAAEACDSFRLACKLEPAQLAWQSNLLFTLLYDPTYDCPALFKEHQRWERQQARALAPLTPDFTNDPAPERRLRIGYISPDFHNHVVGRNIWPLLRNHDHGQFDITLYAHLSRADATTEEFRKCADRWHDITSWPDGRVADQISQDGIDILVDLTMHSAGNRLMIFARKPAPLQITFAAYPGGTGLRTIDYRLSDPYLDPPGLYDPWFAEATYRLPHSFWCYHSPCEEPGVAPLPALTKGFVTFGFLGNFCKINTGVLDVWARVLAASPGSRLLLLATEGSHRQKTIEYLNERSVASERVEFRPRKARAEYLPLYHELDIGLDTFPYNGHTTSLDAFWMGVPVVSLVGDTPVGRGGLSQLTNLGLGELAAATPADFVRAATDLASHLPRLQALRSGLRARLKQSPLMDGVGFARGIEHAYRDMWRTWCRTR